MGAWSTTHGGRQFGDNALSRVSLEPNKLKGKEELYCFWPKNIAKLSEQRASTRHSSERVIKFQTGQNESTFVNIQIFNVSCGFMRTIIRTIHYWIKQIVIWNNFQCVLLH